MAANAKANMAERANRALLNFRNKTESFTHKTCGKGTDGAVIFKELKHPQPTDAVAFFERHDGHYLKSVSYGPRIAAAGGNAVIQEVHALMT